AELVRGLELSKIYGYYGRRDGRGKAAYHPVMMVRVLLYGYCVGVTSSRRIERASYDDIAFRYLCADQHPDHGSMAWFGRQHLPVLAQMLERVEQNMEAKPEAATADTGYFSEEQLTDKRVEGIELYVATGKQKHGEEEPSSDPSAPAVESHSAKEKMKQRLKTEAGRTLYKMRKAIVEPVFGQIKAVRGIRAFRLRGIAKAGAGWKL